MKAIAPDLIGIQRDPGKPYCVGIIVEDHELERHVFWLTTGTARILSHDLRMAIVADEQARA